METHLHLSKESRLLQRNYQYARETRGSTPSYAALVSSLYSRLPDSMSLSMVSRNRNGFLRLLRAPRHFVKGRPHDAFAETVARARNPSQACFEGIGILRLRDYFAPREVVTALRMTNPRMTDGRMEASEIAGNHASVFGNSSSAIA